MSRPLNMIEWAKLGHPDNTWFIITRNEALENANEKTFGVLAHLIKLALQSYGEFEIRQCSNTTAIICSAEVFLFQGIFSVIQTVGNVNGKYVPVLSMSVEARII